MTDTGRRVLEYVRDNEGCGAREISKLLWQTDNLSMRAGQYVGKLVKKGLVRRQGIGGENPVSYYITQQGLISIEEVAE